MTVDTRIVSRAKDLNKRVFRKCFIKRRLASTGLFENDFVEITEDVKKWGKISLQTDSSRINRFHFGNVKINVANDEGKYNPSDDQASIWFGFANRQRTLVKIEAGFFDQTLGTSGIWSTREVPGEFGWDLDTWDEFLVWDDENLTSTVFVGVIGGDIPANDKNTVNLNVKPLTQVFRDFPARNLTGFTSTGMTSSDFMFLLRDQTDGSGEFIFRPFFGDTITKLYLYS